MTKLAIVYHSGYGHTAKVAEHVAKGARGVTGVEVDLIKADDLQNADEGPWESLAAADGIIFGSPTYIVDGDPFYGQDHLGLVERAIQKPFAASAWRNPPVG